MIYKRLTVTALPLRAGQIVGAPLSTMQLRHTDGPLVEIDGRQIKLRYSGFVGPFATKSDPIESARRYRALATDLGAGIDWDCSSKVFVTLRGTFHSPVMVLREAWTFGSKLHYISDSPKAITGSKEIAVTLGVDQAYMLLGDTLFTGEIEYHNTVADRTAPFKWPFLSELTSEQLDKVIRLAGTAQQDWKFLYEGDFDHWVNLPDEERWKPIVPLTAREGLAQLITVLYTDGEESYPLIDGRSVVRSMHCAADSLRLSAMVSKVNPESVPGSSSDAWDVLFSQPGNPHVRFVWHDKVYDNALAAVTSPYVFVYVQDAGTQVLPAKFVVLGGGGQITSIQMKGYVSSLLSFVVNPASALMASAAVGAPISLYRVDPLRPEVS